MPNIPQRGARFFRNFMSVTAGNYGAIGLSFALNVILTWRLGAEQFGRLALLITAVQVLTCVITNWTVTALVRFGAQEFAATGTTADVFWARTWLVLPWIAAAAAVLSAGQETAAAYLEVSIGSVWILFVYFLLSSLLATCGALFQATQRMDRYAATLFADKALAVLGVLWMPAPYGHEPAAVLACYALSSLLVSTWAVAALGRRMFLPLRIPRGVIGQVWRFSFPMILSTLVGLAGTQWIQYAVIKHYLPFREVGLYSLANQVAGVVQQITIISSSLLLPHFSVLVAKKQEAEIRRLVEKVVPHGLLAFAFLLSLLALLMRPALPLMFGPDFSGSVSPVILLLVATMGLALFNTFMALTYAWGDTWSVTVATMVSAGVNLASSLWLIQDYGIKGVAAATVLGHGTAALIMLAGIQRRLGVKAVGFGLLGLPVVAVAVCDSLVEGVHFYWLGAAGAAASIVLLVGVFGLFRRDALRQILGGEAGLPLALKSGLKALSERAG